MALVAAWRSLLAGRATAAAAPLRALAAGGATTAAEAVAHLQTSAAAAAGGSGGAPDPFTQTLQAKAEAELAALLERRLAEQQARGAAGAIPGHGAGAAAGAGSGQQGGAEAQGQELEVEEEEEFVDPINPETGEIGGPKGKEPTRYGDWERGGRAIDF